MHSSRPAASWLRQVAAPACLPALTTCLVLLVLHWSGFSLRLLPSGYIGVGGDSLLNSWSIYQALDNLAHRPLDLGYSPIFYGDPAPFAYTIAPYGIALVVWPVYLLSGGNLVLTYNLYLSATFPLTAWAAYLLCRYLLGGSRLNAALAGLMFAFAQPRMMHLAHVEQLSMHLLLLTLYCLHRLLDTPRLRWAVGLAIVSSLTLLTSGYLAMAAVVGGAVILGYLLVRRPRAFDRRRVILLGGAAGLSILLSAPFLLFRFQNPVFSAGRSYAEIMLYSAPLEGFAAGTSLLYHNLNPAVGQESRLFLGFAPIGLSVVAWYLRKTAPSAPTGTPDRLLTGQDVVVLYGIMALVGCILAVGPALQVGGKPIAPMPYALIMGLPGFSSLRVPARFIILAVTGTAVLSAFALDRAAGRLPRPMTWLATAAIAGLLTAELMPFNVVCTQPATPDFDEGCHLSPITAWVPQANVPVDGWLAQQPPGTAVMHYPATGPQAYDYYAYLPAERQPMLNGEGVSFFPGWWQQTDWESFPDLSTMALLKQRGIEYAIVHYGLLSPDETARLKTRWEQFEATWGKIPLVRQFGSDACYEVSLTPAGHLRLDFDQTLPGSGWGGPETDDGKSFQWMGREATLLLPLVRSAPLTIRFQTYSALRPESLKTLRLAVDGRLIRLTSRPGEGGTTIFEGMILPSREANSQALSLLKLVSGSAARPVDLGQGSDTRTLSVALDWLEIAPQAAH